MKKLLVFVLLLFLMNPIPSRDKVLSEFVIDRFLEAIGGKELILNLQTRVESASVTN